MCRLCLGSMVRCFLLMPFRPLSVPFACWHGIYHVYMYNIYTLYGCKLQVPQVPRASLMVWSSPIEIGRRNTTGTCTNTSLWTGLTKRTFLQEKSLGCEEQKCQRVNSIEYLPFETSGTATCGTTICACLSHHLGEKVAKLILNNQQKP